MVWIGRIRGGKIKRDFMIRSFALIQCSNKTVPNAPKPYDMEQNMSLGSHVVFLMCSQRKVPMQLRGMNFCINCTSTAHFAPILVQQRNFPKCTQTLRNASKHEFRVQWCGSGAFVAKCSDTTSWHELLHLLHQFGPFAPSLVQQQNGHKCTQTLRNATKT